MANTNTREAQQRALAKLAERRNREDTLIGTVTDALVTREQATEALAAAEAALAAAVTGLAELGIGRDELAEILEVPAEQLGGRTRGRPRRTTPLPAAPETDTAPAMPPVAGNPDPKPARTTGQPARTTGQPARTTGKPRKARATPRPDAAG